MDHPYNQPLKFIPQGSGGKFDWLSLESHSDILSQSGYDWGINTLKSGLEQTVKSVILEPRYICKDFRNLFSNYYSKKFIVGSPYCERLHFFSEIIKEDDFFLEPANFQDSYLGFSVIRPVPRRCLGRTVINPYKALRGRKGFYCLNTKFNTNIAGINLSVLGYPYTSQDIEATCCAHSCLWTVCRYLSERYTRYAEMLPYDLILLAADNRGRKAPYHGLMYEDYSHILSQFGCFPIIMSLQDHQGNKIQEAFLDLYTYVESGFPILASIYKHVIALTGHTIDYNRTVTPGRNGFIDSSQYLKSYVIVDDNQFPYSELGYAGDPDNSGLIYKNLALGVPEQAIETIRNAVCPLPEKAFLPADRARKQATEILTGLLKNCKLNNLAPFVTRLYLTSGTSFKKKKRQQGILDNDILSLMVTNLSLPHFIWVMEVSTVDQYKSGKCLGEIVLNSTSGGGEEYLIYWRIASQMVIDEKEIPNSGPAEFGQYKNNLGEKS